ncbi:uncharacterized protein LOC135687133 isoform X6 [Rhopilema esculentum]|uniref:uncharacterized protein LOC135687133 isoform X6 n=1 Tax=Rhopilema esculentum TaxID=499914 RepID=UPI0031D0CE07
MYKKFSTKDPLDLIEKESSRQKSQVKPKTFGCSYATVVKGKKHIKNDMMSYKLPAVLECHGREDRSILGSDREEMTVDSFVEVGGKIEMKDF